MGCRGIAITSVQVFAGQQLQYRACRAVRQEERDKDRKDCRLVTYGTLDVGIDVLVCFETRRKKGLRVVERRLLLFKALAPDSDGNELL